MPNRLIRALLILFDGFLALTAIGGGLGLLSGLMAPPMESLAGSIFGNYLVPGLSLVVLVGGSALVSTALLVRNHRLAPALAAMSGLAIIIFETVEVLVIGSPAGYARTLQILYFSLGLLILLTSLAPLADLRRSSARA
jgi:hypothetical protein